MKPLLEIGAEVALFVLVGVVLLVVAPVLLVPLSIRALVGLVRIALGWLRPVA